jgi:F0F1-type ATP synthase assembly protein I
LETTALIPVTLRTVARKQTAGARYAEYTGLALLLPASTFVGYAIGYYLDKAFGTTWLQIVFLILGSVGGFVALIRQIMRDSNDDDA